jgi:hypothetical protein
MSKRATKPFAPHAIAMLESPALGAVSLAGRRVLDRIEIELARHGGKDNGRLPVTWRDFERFGIDRGAIGPALRELQHLGLIEITERGVAGNAGYRSPNLFRLTYRDAAGAPATDDWTRITSSGQAKRIARAARKEISPQRRVKKARSRDRTTQFPSRGFPTFKGGNSPPNTGWFSPPKARKRQESQGGKSPPLSISSHLERGTAKSRTPSDPLRSSRSGPPPPRRRRPRARARTNHSKQEGNAHDKH